MARKLEVVIVGDSSSLERAFGRASKSGSGLGSTLKSLGKVAAVGVGAAFAGMAVLVKQGFDEIAEGQKVAAQTNAVLKSTGGIANVTAKEVANLASEQSKLTGIDDELIQSSENLLLTFKNVRNEVGANNDVFNQATEAALDLSTAGFGSVESASKMMGKALNDPIKGMTALGRAGVTFSEDQKKAIAALVKTGDLLGAQKIILGEVQSQVGGSAKAYGETLPGQLNKLKNSFDDLAAGVAGVFLPALTSAIDFVNDTVIPALSKAGDTIKDFWKNMTGELAKAPDLRAKIRIVFSNVKELAGKLVSEIVDAIESILPQKPIKMVPKLDEAGLRAVGGGVDWNVIANDMVAALAEALKASVELGLAIADLITRSFNEIDWAALGQKMAPGFVTLLGAAIVTALDPTFWIRHWELALSIALVAFGGAIGKFAGKAALAVLGPMRGLGTELVGRLVAAINDALPRLGPILIAGIATAINLALRAIGSLWGKIDDLFAKLAGKLGSTLTSILKVGFVLAAVNAIEGLLSSLASGWMKVVAWIQGLRPQVVAAFSGAASWLYNAGAQILQGLWDGLKSKWDAVAGWLGGLGGKIVDLKGPNDAVLLTKSGQLIMQSLQNGLGSGWGPIENWLSTLGPKMAEKIGEAIDAAAAAVTAKQGAFTSAFETLASNALSAFDKITQAYETQTEKLIRLQDERLARMDRKRALQEAQAAVAQASAQQQSLAPEQFENFDAYLNAVLAAGEERKQAEQQLADAKFAIQRAGDEKRAAQERLDYEASRERQRVSLEGQLRKLQTHYLNQELTTKQFHRNLIGIFKDFEIPLGKQAKSVGLALAQGLNDSFADVERAAKALANEILTQFSRIRVIVNIETQVKEQDTKHRQHGGPVRAGSPYVVGEAGPELFIPRGSGTIVPNGNGRGTAGGIVNINFYGPTVGTSREFEDTVRRALYDVNRRNPGIGFAT